MIRKLKIKSLKINCLRSYKAKLNISGSSETIDRITVRCL